METPSNQPDHRLKGLHDMVSFVGELEHVRRHAIRSIHSVRRQLLDSPDDVSLQEKEIRYSIVAERCKNLRRNFMQEKFGHVDDEDWCLLKGSSSLRQLAYELMPDMHGLFQETESLVDAIWGSALGEDMSGCKTCKEDRENGKTCKEDRENGNA